MLQSFKLWAILAFLVGIQMEKIAGQVSKIVSLKNPPPEICSQEKSLCFILKEVGLSFFVGLVTELQVSEPPNQSCLSDTSGEAFTAVGAFVPETLSQEVMGQTQPSIKRRSTAFSC